MDPITITTNGVTSINNHHSASATTLYVSGTIGAATLELVDSISGATLVDGILSVGEQYIVKHGARKDISLRVSGADGSTAVIMQGVAY